MKTKLPKDWGEVNSDDVYLFGSHRYNTETNDSDIDRLIIHPALSGEYIYVDSHKHNFYFLSRAEFQQRLEDHDPIVLECWISDNSFNIDLGKLRQSFSKVSSNSWTKAKKKINQGDIELGIKSAFHAIRLLDFAIQLAETSSIGNWSKYNYVLADLRQQEEVTWELVHSKYDTLYKELRSRFKKVAKIENTERWQTQEKVRTVLAKYGHQNTSLTKEIMEIFDYA